MKTITQKTSLAAKARSLVRAFTLIELLVVIAIIAILAAMLMPVLSIAQKHAKITEAKTEIMNIHAGVTAYESDYSRFPVPVEAQTAGMGSFTAGGIFSSPNGPFMVGSTNPPPGGVIYTNNSVVMAILLDYTNYPNNYLNGTWTDNTNYQKNPKQNVYVQVKPSGWDPTKGGPPQPGLGNDLVYRDPWGNPYVITMDLNDDNAALDPFYQWPGVSSSTQAPGGSGLNGLSSQSLNGGNNNVYAFHGNVMVWSAGPDGQIDYTNTAIQGLNKDNVVSWQ
jgi:prepilin-type N-terminal cleavage/methylation domain-containing protein